MSWGIWLGVVVLAAGAVYLYLSLCGRKASGDAPGRDGMLCIYISGPYTADTVGARDVNVEKANIEAMRWARKGWAPYCPHTQSHNWENDTDLRYEDFMAIDKEWVSRSDAICMLPGWQASKGARQEHQWAIEFGIPRYYCETRKWEGE